MATRVPSYCRICEACCGIVAEVVDGRIRSIRGDADHPSSRGLMCPKGKLMAEVTHDPERVLQPVRGDRKGSFAPVSWDEALDDIARRLEGLVGRYGGESLAMYYGNPAAFSSTAGGHALTRFAQAIGARGGLYSPAPQDTTSRYVASQLLYGSNLELPLPDLDSTDFLLCVGANPLISHGSLVSSGRFREQMDEIVGRGGRVVVIDPARTKTAERFEHVSVAPGGDALLLAAMLHVVFAESLVSERAGELATGIDVLAGAVGAVTPESVAWRTGVGPETVRALAIAFATAESACAYGRLGVCRGEFPTLTNYLLDALNVVTGNVDRRGGVVFGDGLVDFASLNARAYSAHGSERTRVGGLPVVNGRKPWVLAEEIQTPGPGQIRGLFIISGNPVASAPDAANLRAAFAELELLVSIDLYVTESNEHADYVLPAPTFLEREDVLLSFTSRMTRPWTQWTPAVVPRIGDTREEHEIYDGLMRRLGVKEALDPWGMIDDMIRSGPRGQEEGWTLARIKQHPHGVELGGAVATGILANRIRSHTSGARRTVDLGVREVLAQIHDALQGDRLRPGELRLIGRRDLRGINSWLHNVRVVHTGGKPALHMHPADAEARGIQDGSVATVTSSSGSISVPVTVTEGIHPGAVSYPHGWGHSGRWNQAVSNGGANVNEVIPNDPDSKDPLSGMSFLDGVPVTVTAGRNTE